MQRSLLVIAASMLVVLPAAVVACSSDSGSAAVNPAGDDASASPTPTVDAAPPPQAQGNPCRGVPVTAGQHYVPAGMCANAVAKGLNGLRQITFAPNGDLFGVISATGEIKRLHDADGDGFFQASEITTYATTGNGNGTHLDLATGYLYAGATGGVMRWPYGPTATTGGKGEVVVANQPEGGHNKHTVHVYDGYLYVHSGSAGNMNSPKGAEYDDDRSLIRRFPLSSFTPAAPFDWLSGEVVTQGLRNAVGFTKNAAGRMYAVVNGMDDISYQGQNVHNDNPGEQVVELGMGKKYGFPFCFTAQRVVAGGQVVAPGTQLQVTGGVHDDAWCAANSSPPATFIQAHSAPLDITFFDAHPKGGLPERYRGGAFVALHGSWDRNPATGCKVIWIPFDDNGNVPPVVSTMTDTKFPYETVFGGGDASAAKDGPWSWTGPNDFGDQPAFVGVAVSPVDGALYATSSTGYLYRIGVPN